MSKESESYRLYVLRDLQNRYGKGDPPEVLEAQKVIAEFREKQAEAEKAISRVEAGLPKPDLCPKCWFTKGHESILYAVVADR